MVPVPEVQTSTVLQNQPESCGDRAAIPSIGEPPTMGATGSGIARSGEVAACTRSQVS